MTGGTGLPARPPGRPHPRDLLALLAEHLGERGAAGLCADLLAADDPHDHAATVLFLGGTGRTVAAGGRHVVEGVVGPGLGGPRAALRLGRHRRPGGARPPRRRRLAGRRDVPQGVGPARAALRRRRRPAGRPRPAPGARPRPPARSGGCGDSEHLAAVRRLLADPDPDVRRAAARALERLEQRLDL